MKNQKSRLTAHAVIIQWLNIGWGQKFMHYGTYQLIKYAFHIDMSSEIFNHFHYKSMVKDPISKLMRRATDCM